MNPRQRIFGLVTAQFRMAANIFQYVPVVVSIIGESLYTTTDRFTRTIENKASRLLDLALKALSNILITLTKIADFVLDQINSSIAFGIYFAAAVIKRTLGQRAAVAFGTLALALLAVSTFVAVLVTPLVIYPEPSVIGQVIFPNFAGFIIVGSFMAATTLFSQNLEIFQARIESDYLLGANVQELLNKRSSIIQDATHRFLYYETQAQRDARAAIGSRATPTARLDYSEGIRLNAEHIRRIMLSNAANAAPVVMRAVQPPARGWSRGDVDEPPPPTAEEQSRRQAAIALDRSRREIAANALNNLAAAAAVPAPVIVRDIPAEFREKINAFDTEIDISLQRRNFCSLANIIGELRFRMLYVTPTAYETNYQAGSDNSEQINALELLRRESRYSYDKIWEGIDQRRLDSAVEEHPALRCFVAARIMNIPVYLNKRNGERTYMDLLTALSCYATNQRNPENRDPFTLNNLQYDEPLHREIMDLKARLQAPIAENIAANSFDDALDAAIAAKNIGIVFAYLRRKGGTPLYARLINWTAELKAEVANSKYRTAPYWQGKLTLAQRRTIETGNPHLCSFVDFELLRVPIIVGAAPASGQPNNQTTEIGLLEIFDHMQTRHMMVDPVAEIDINPRNRLPLRSLEEITFDEARMTQIDACVGEVNQAVPPVNPGILNSFAAATAGDGFNLSEGGNTLQPGDAFTPLSVVPADQQRSVNSPAPASL